MKYRRYIEDNFLIDEPKSGKLVPFKFNKVQDKYYKELVLEYDIEETGLQNPVREIILKARREGFSSFVLALFAADDILSDNPTETNVISYKDDATKVFRKRYRTYITSAGARKMGYSASQIAQNPGILDLAAKQVLAVDSQEFKLKHNGARFFCGTASARVGGRGGVVQKLLFSEAAFYPDKKEMRAKEIIEGTLRQVDIDSGWVFVESTANGDMNHYAKMWNEAEGNESRFSPRFYGWKEFYTEEQFELIKREFTDKRMIPQEYPETAQEAFLASGDRYFNPKYVQMLVSEESEVVGDWKYYEEFKPGHRYALGVDVAEGVGRHNSTIVVIDFDHNANIQGRLVKIPKVVAVYASNKIKPDTLASEIKNVGTRYGNCIVAVEKNNHGHATLVALKDIYFNIYKDEKDNLGWHTNLSTKPRMLHDLRTGINEGSLDIPDKALKSELMSFQSHELNDTRFDEEDETRGHFDRVIALAIAWQMRGIAQPAQSHEMRDPKFTKEEDFNRYASFNEI